MHLGIGVGAVPAREGISGGWRVKNLTTFCQDSASCEEKISEKSEGS
jgi:hypothetical protein